MMSFLTYITGFFWWILNFCWFRQIMQIRKKGGWNLKKIFSSGQSLVEIGQMVSNKKIVKWFFAFLCLICIIGQNRQKFKVHQKNPVIYVKKLIIMLIQFKLKFWNYRANLNQTLLKWSLGGPFSKFYPSAPSNIQDGRRHWQTQFWKGTTQGSFQQGLVEIGTVVSEEKILRDFLWTLNFCLFWPIMQIRKKGGWNFLKIFSSETTEPISTKLCWNDSWVVLFQNCVQHFRTPTKMAVTAELNLT
jgi:hypothetical protein